MCVCVHTHTHTHKVSTRRSELGAFGEESVMCFRSSGIKDEPDHFSKQNQRKCYESSEKSETILCAKWYARARTHTQTQTHILDSNSNTQRFRSFQSDKLRFNCLPPGRTSHCTVKWEKLQLSFKFFYEFRNNQTNLLAFSARLLKIKFGICLWINLGRMK